MTNNPTIATVYHWKDKRFELAVMGSHVVYAHKKESMPGHTHHCLVQSAKSDFERWAYFLRWPHTCTHCDGHGEFRYYDSQVGLDGADPCGFCVEEGICPRCGKQVWSDEDWDNETVVCPECGFVEGPNADREHPDQYPPIPYECACYDNYYWEC